MCGVDSDGMDTGGGQDLDIESGGSVWKFYGRRGVVMARLFLLKKYWFGAERKN